MKAANLFNLKLGINICIFSHSFLDAENLVSFAPPPPERFSNQPQATRAPPHSGATLLAKRGKTPHILATPLSDTPPWHQTSLSVPIIDKNFLSLACGHALRLHI